MKSLNRLVWTDIIPRSVVELARTTKFNELVAMDLKGKPIMHPGFGQQHLYLQNAEKK